MLLVDTRTLEVKLLTYKTIEKEYTQLAQRYNDSVAELEKDIELHSNEIFDSIKLIDRLKEQFILGFPTVFNTEIIKSYLILESNDEIFVDIIEVNDGTTQLEEGKDYIVLSLNPRKTFSNLNKLIFYFVHDYTNELINIKLEVVKGDLEQLETMMPIGWLKEKVYTLEPKYFFANKQYFRTETFGRQFK